MRWRRGAGEGNVRRLPGGRAALPLGGGVVAAIVTVLVLLLGGGRAYDVGSPFEPFPSQTRAAGDGSAMQNAPDAQSKLFAFLDFVIGDLQKFWAADFQPAAQRAGWYKRGFDDGDATACDTFSGDI